jgi:phenylpropionate dioxygenase-like ring-hydroxylating dioxygenase large terminal subunit
MERATMLRFTEALRAGHQPVDEPVFTVPAAVYRDGERWERERAMLAKAPRIVAASSEIAAGSCIPIDVPGASAILARTADGTLRGFANACRHRATRLVDAPCTKAITCPYHAWTYDLAGALIHVPHERTFGGLDLATRGLAPVPVGERAGLVWLGEPPAELAGDLAALGLDRHVVWKRARAVRRCNWKLVVEAFLDGYHIRVLHRDSVYRFFLDAAVVAERRGPHIIAMTGRRALTEAPAELAGAELRTLATPSYLVFPATTIVVHPDFVSIIIVHPLAPDLTEWEHTMLVPADRAGEVEHWQRSWTLIEEGVFQREDLWVCEQAQRAISAGAADELVFGTLEAPARWFHTALEAAL